MTPREILIAARAKIEAPERWTKGEFARTEDGKACRSSSDAASCYCMEGAVLSQPYLWRKKARACAILRLAVVTLDYPTTPSWNDAPDRTHAEVLAAFDRAIELAGDA